MTSSCGNVGTAVSGCGLTSISFQTISRSIRESLCDVIWLEGLRKVWRRRLSGKCVSPGVALVVSVYDVVLTGMVWAEALSVTWGRQTSG